MTFRNPNVPWSELERRLSDDPLGRGPWVEPAPGDGGDSPAWSRKRDRYAPPLLEGCGTIKKNSLRVVGKTDPVPFIAAFATDRVSAADRTAITAALMKIGENRELCAAMESKSGFVEPPAAGANARASAEKK